MARRQDFGVRHELTTEPEVTGDDVDRVALQVPAEAELEEGLTFDLPYGYQNIETDEGMNTEDDESYSLDGLSDPSTEEATNDGEDDERDTSDGSNTESGIDSALGEDDGNDVLTTMSISDVSDALEQQSPVVEPNQSRGQHAVSGDQAFRCLPYATKNRAAKRELIRWNDEMHAYTLLAMTWVLEVKGVEVPWDEVAAIVQPGATAEAFKQASLKLRARRINEDLAVPPSRPGRGKPRAQCRAELDQIMSEAHHLRGFKNAKTGSSSNGPTDNDQSEEASETSAEHSTSAAEPCTSRHRSPVKHTERWVNEMTRKHYSAVTFLAATGQKDIARTRPSSRVRDLQEATNGLDVDLHTPDIGSVNKISAIRPAFQSSALARRRSNPLAPQEAAQDRPTTPPTQTQTQTQSPDHLVAVTPPPRLRTPDECPPAPRSRSNSDYSKRIGHMRKRSSDDIGLPPATPKLKRVAQSSASRRSHSRKNSLVRIPESELPVDGLMQPPVQMSSLPLYNTSAYFQPFPSDMQGNPVQMPSPLQSSYADMRFNNASRQLTYMQQVSSATAQPFIPAAHQTSIHQMTPPQMQLQQTQNPYLSTKGSTVSDLPTPQTQAQVQRVPEYQDMEPGRSAAFSAPQAYGKVDTSNGVVLSNLVARDTAPTANSPAITASPVRSGGSGNVTFSSSCDTMWDLTTGGDFISPVSDMFPAMGDTDDQPLSLLFAQPGDDYYSETCGPWGAISDESLQHTINSPNDHDVLGISSTQSSFDSTAEDARTTPVQPRAAGIGDDGVHWMNDRE